MGPAAHGGLATAATVIASQAVITGAYSVVSQAVRTAVLLNRGKDTAPLALRTAVEHNQVLHEHVVIVSVITCPVPRVPDGERIDLDHLGFVDGMVHVGIHYGYMEKPSVLPALRLLDSDQTEGPIDLDDASFVLSKIELVAGPEPTMAAWRRRLFIATSLLTADAAEYFGLPRDRVVIVGSRIEVQLVGP